MIRYYKTKLGSKLCYAISLVLIIFGMIVFFVSITGDSPKFMSIVHDFFSYLPDDGIILSACVILSAIALTLIPWLLAWFLIKKGSKLDKEAHRLKREKL
jgi:energy-coupling factor transporter transmembrane protein EcfT